MSSTEEEIVDDSADDRPRTRTRTRTEYEVDVDEKTIEEDEHLCPNCSQWFEEDDIVPVGLGVEPDEESYTSGEVTDAEEYDQLCVYCAEKVFGYTPPTGGATLSWLFPDDIEYWSGRDFAWAVVGTIAPILIIGVVGLVLTNFMAGSIDAVTRAFEEVAIGAAQTTGEASDETMLPGDFLQVMLLGLVGLIAAQLLHRVGGGR